MRDKKKLFRKYKQVQKGMTTQHRYKIEETEERTNERISNPCMSLDGEVPSRK